MSQQQLQQAFPSSMAALFPATNPTAMHQFVKPARNKHAGRQQRSLEAMHFLAKLTGSRRTLSEESGARNGLPLPAPLDWSCKGDFDDDAWNGLKSYEEVSQL